MDVEANISVESRRAALERMKQQYLAQTKFEFALYDQDISELYTDDYLEEQSPQTTDGQLPADSIYSVRPNTIPNTNTSGGNRSATAQGNAPTTLLQERLLQAAEVELEPSAMVGAEIRTVASTLGGAVTLDLSNPHSFALSPVPRGAQVQCYIVRARGGLRNIFSTTYECFLQGDDTFIAGAKKEGAKASTYFSFSTERKKYDKNSQGYLGKLRANFMGTEFSLFDKGVNPSKEPMADPDRVRKEMAVVTYEPNMLASKGPRKMTVMVPLVRDNDTVAVWRPQKPVEGLLANYRAACVEQMSVFCNRMPKWNEQLAAYVLNFNGRVTMPSVKNFQLVREGGDDILLQFGKTGKDHFTMDFTWPFSPLQAFAICISALDNKLACE